MVSFGALIECLWICFRCVFRFPSTNIKLVFQSLVEDTSSHPQSSSRESIRGQSMAPLRVNIPDSTDPDFASPIPSPAGTIR